MQASDANVLAVLSQYDFAPPPRQIEPLGSAGGFSGACFWRIGARDGPWCLRRWPSEHPGDERLWFIYRTLSHASAQGLTIVPTPVLTKENAPFVWHRGRFWELARWMPGEADFHRQFSWNKLHGAMAVLARFHLAVETAPHAAKRRGRPPAVVDRLKLFQRLTSGGMEQIQANLRETPSWPGLKDRADRLLELIRQAAPRVGRSLYDVQDETAVLHACIRDVWHDHILFTGDLPTGLIDFGAMRIDSPAADLARLLGSLAGDREELWHEGLAAYHRARPLADEERRLAPILDQSGVLLGAANWLHWIFVERRTFEDRQRVLARLDELEKRLQRLLEA